MMNSEILSLNIVENVEFSLDETLDHLKDIQKEKKTEIDELTDIIRNNAVRTLNQSVSFEDILKKKQQVLQSLEKLVLNECPQNLPIQKTADFYTSAIQGLEDEVLNMTKLLEQMQNELSTLKSDVIYLESKRTGFEKMKNAALEATEDEAKNTYEKEYAATKRLFSDVKADLQAVIEIIFPENDYFHEFLRDLSKAQLKGGDDVYVNVTPKTIYYTHFLVSTGIIMYHPNDNSRVKMINLL